VINKDVIKMDERLYAYLLQHTREDPILRKLREETNTMRGSQMQISPEQGQWQQQVVKLMGARRAIEVGVFTGYSSLCTAMALPQKANDGQESLLVACDNDERTLAVASRYWVEAGVNHMIRPMLGPGKDSLQTLLDEGGAGTYDLAFIDADKSGYIDYYEMCLELVRPGGVVMVDNVLWYGRVADPEEQKKPTVAIRAFNEHGASDPRVDFVIVPIGDGVAMCRKR